MDNARVQLDLDRLGRSGAGLVIAGLSVQVGEVHFPNRQWTDFVVVVLSWWAEAFVRLLRGDLDRVEARFMEGPFLMELQQAGTGLWRMRLVEAGLKRRVQGETVIQIGPFVRTCLEACERTLETCRNHGWWSSDAQALSIAAANLRKETQGLLN
jgi:hypothetical protein